MPPKTPPRAPERPPAFRNERREALRRTSSAEGAGDQLARVAELDEELDALRIRFEQFFLGITRKPPVAERAALRSAILQLKTAFLRNTAVKFRVNMLHNRLLTYERLWDRTLREIESGTYRRDLFRARLHRERGGAGVGTAAGKVRRRVGEGPGATAVGEAPSDSEGGREALPEAGAPGRSGGERRETPAAGQSSAGVGAGGGLDPARIEAIHAAYVAARRRCRESTEGITVEALASALRRQVPRLLEKHRARAVDFQVVIQNGKAVLKAIPR